MSRKSRSRSKLELVREPATEPAADDRLTVHRLTGELQETLEAIISACAFLAKGPIPPGLLEPESEAEADEPLDDAALDALDADLDDVGRALDGVSFTTRILARALIARTLDRHPLHVAPLTDTAQSAAEAVVENAALDDFARALTPSSFPPELRPSRTERKAAFDDAAFLVREVGLEEFDVSCDLETGDDGVPELLTVPVSPETAHVELLEFLFERAEGAMLQQDAFLAIERDASSWEFSRWSVSPPPGRGAPDVMHFARRVREEEYSLVERPCVALGRTMMNEIADDDGFAELFPRQHRMAEALSASFVDVFECLAVDGSRVTMRSIRDGETYAVHEHLEPVEYSNGWVGAGRLIPFDGELHLRSPGMVFTRANDLELARAAANDVDALRDVLPPALVVEAFISTAMFGLNVPREMKPARSRAEAREVLAELQLALADGEVQLDPTLEGFVSALADQGDPGPVGTTQSGTGAGSKAKRKPKRRR